MYRLSTIGVVALALGACGEPPTPRTPDGSVVEALPEMSEWAQDMQNRPLNEVVSSVENACVGYVDDVEGRFVGDPSGVQLTGWGWDAANTRPYQRFLVVDENDVIVGAGEGGLERNDVVAAVPAVTAPGVGFRVLSTQSSGLARVFGLAQDGQAACQLGPGLEY